MATQTATKPSLTLKRRFNAPPAKVYAAWTDPKKIARWFGPAERRERRAPRPTCASAAAITSSCTCRATGMTSCGVYREVVPNEKLVFTWAWKSTPERESLVTVTFKPDGDGTILTLLHEQFFDEDARDRHQHGWTGAIDKLEKLFA